MRHCKKVTLLSVSHPHARYYGGRWCPPLLLHFVINSRNLASVWNQVKSLQRIWVPRKQLHLSVRKKKIKETIWNKWNRYIFKHSWFYKHFNFWLTSEYLSPNVRAGLYWWLGSWVAGWCMNNGLIWSCREWWQFAAAASLYINTNHGSWQPRHQHHNRFG